MLTFASIFSHNCHLFLPPPDYGYFQAPPMWIAYHSPNTPCPFVTLWFYVCFYSWKIPAHPSKYNSNVISHLCRQRYPLAPSSVNIPIPSCSAIYLFAHLSPSPWVQGQCLNHFQKIVSTHKYLWSEWIDYAWYFQCLLAHLSVSSLGNVSPTLP